MCIEQKHERSRPIDRSCAGVGVYAYLVSCFSCWLSIESGLIWSFVGPVVVISWVRFSATSLDQDLSYYTLKYCS